jgi:cell division protein FtsW (lipid II flippase)
MRSAAKRIRDFAAYLAVALAIGLSAIWFAAHSSGMRDDFIVKWLGLSVNTAILYGYVVKDGRRFWHVWGFWFATVAVLILHLIAFIVILRRVDRWGALWFLPMYPIEISILSVAYDWVSESAVGRSEAQRSRCPNQPPATA